eukprot:CAMPEP_0119046290 /NCGR_PEP_ID=MMETSP1177-20130426/45634_1 /TAXON_ID=2985 /ORGANISM="Ochromonas sp, Strain CCMP1899" /LENGTH=188 /DNA_ID=CAMNT_0007019233 /DNA_START=261 /DNA_END=824 /DNA_ORIENTATION=+
MIKLWRKGEGGMGKCRSDAIGGILKHKVDIFRDEKINIINAEGIVKNIETLDKPYMNGDATFGIVAYDPSTKVNYKQEIVPGPYHEWEFLVDNDGKSNGVILREYNKEIMPQSTGLIISEERMQSLQKSYPTNSRILSEKEINEYNNNNDVCWGGSLLINDNNDDEYCNDNDNDNNDNMDIIEMSSTS